MAETEKIVEGIPLEGDIALLHHYVQSQEPAAFVELVAPRPQSLPECTIELEGRRGKLRIQLRNTSVSYLAKLSRELLESAS